MCRHIISPGFTRDSAIKTKPSRSRKRPTKNTRSTSSISKRCRCSTHSARTDASKNSFKKWACPTERKAACAVEQRSSAFVCYAEKIKRPYRSTAFEVLHGLFVLFGRALRLESTQISSLARFLVFFSRIKTITALNLSGHSRDFFFGRALRLESTQISSLARFWVFLARIQTIAAFNLADHDRDVSLRTGPAALRANQSATSPARIIRSIAMCCGKLQC